MSKRTSLLLVGCGFLNYASAQQPNILLIVAEDMSLDLGCYGNKHVYTPNLDELADEGCRFTNAYSTYSVSSPSRGCIFTGLYPHQNGQIGLATHKYELFPEVKTLPTYLSQLGYRTGCIGKIHVNPESALPFDFWAIHSPNFAKKGLNRYAENAFDFVTSSDKPFFLMVNFPDAHFPVQRQVEGLPSHLVDVDGLSEGLQFIGANTPRIRENTANYYNCINRLDESIGMLLDTLKSTKKLDNTLIIFISDHGASFSRSKHSSYEAGVKIPFIVKYPRLVPKGEVREEMLSTIDLLPTFITLGDGEIPFYLPGRNILELWTKSDVSWREYIYTECMGSFPQVNFPCRAVRNKRYKLILNENFGMENLIFSLYCQQKADFAGGTSIEEIKASSKYVQDGYTRWQFPPKYELYDLEQDPNEWYNLGKDKKYEDVLKELSGNLYNWRVKTSDLILNPEKLDKVNREMKKVYNEKEINKYQKNESFKYEYVDYLNPYRDD